MPKNRRENRFGNIFAGIAIGLDNSGDDTVSQFSEFASCLLVSLCMVQSRILYRFHCTMGFRKYKKKCVRLLTSFFG